MKASNYSTLRTSGDPLKRESSWFLLTNFAACDPCTCQCMKTDGGYGDRARLQTRRRDVKTQRPLVEEIIVPERGPRTRGPWGHGHRRRLCTARGHNHRGATSRRLKYLLKRKANTAPVRLDMLAPHQKTVGQAPGTHSEISLVHMAPMQPLGETVLDIGVASGPLRVSLEFGMLRPEVAPLTNSPCGRFRTRSLISMS